MTQKARILTFTLLFFSCFHLNFCIFSFKYFSFIKEDGLEFAVELIKMCEESGNASFLLCILKLLRELLKNVPFLREQTCPNEVKKLCNHKVFAIHFNATKIIQEWLQPIPEKQEHTSHSLPMPSSARNSSSEVQLKRKSSTSNMSIEHHHPPSNMSATNSSSEKNLKRKSSDDSTIVMNGKTEKKATTAKVKMGKCRLDLSVLLSSASNRTKAKASVIKKKTLGKNMKPVSSFRSITSTIATTIEEVVEEKVVEEHAPINVSICQC